MNYRPEYSHHWSNKTYYTQLRLDPLGKESANEMLSALLGDGTNLLPLKRLIISGTRSANPTTRALAYSGLTLGRWAIPTRPPSA